MLPAGLLDPGDEGVIAAHKARAFAASGCGLFVESAPSQAEAIHALTGLPVACPRAERVWQKGDAP